MHSNRCTEKGRRSLSIGLVSINETTVFAILTSHGIDQKCKATLYPFSRREETESLVDVFGQWH
jgi:hypothetical protein